ncbi:MAG: hypothetical protein AB7V50_04875 [Vampirovibrionia bacterium]
MTIPRGYVPGKTDFPEITSSTGTISFDNDNLKTTGNITVNNQTLTQGIQITSSSLKSVGVNQDIMLEANSSGYCVIKGGSSPGGILFENGNGTILGRFYSSTGLLSTNFGVATNSIRPVNTNDDITFDSSVAGTGNVIVKSGNYIQFKNLSNTELSRLFPGGLFAHYFNMSVSGSVNTYKYYAIDDIKIVDEDRTFINRADTTANRPSTPVTGQQYFDTTLAKMIVWNGTAWVNFNGTAL